MRLKELRQEGQLTQKTIANYLHIEQSTYARYENNSRQLPLEFLILLAEYYDVSTDYILGITDVDIPYPRK